MKYNRTKPIAFKSPSGEMLQPGDIVVYVSSGKYSNRSLGIFLGVGYARWTKKPYPVVRKISRYRDVTSVWSVNLFRGNAFKVVDLESIDIVEADETLKGLLLKESALVKAYVAARF